jgi:hypothetical protein
MVNDAAGHALAEGRANATAVVIAPSVRLKRPVPHVRSAITSTDTTLEIAIKSMSLDLLSCLTG